MDPDLSVSPDQFPDPAPVQFIHHIDLIEILIILLRDLARTMLFIRDPMPFQTAFGRRIDIISAFFTGNCPGFTINVIAEAL